MYVPCLVLTFRRLEIAPPFVNLLGTFEIVTFCRIQCAPRFWVDLAAFRKLLEITAVLLGRLAVFAEGACRGATGAIRSGGSITSRGKIPEIPDLRAT